MGDAVPAGSGCSQEMHPPMGTEWGETVPWVGSWGVLLDVGVGSEVVVPWVARCS